MNETSSSFSEVRPDAEVLERHMGKEVLHNENAEWFKELKKERVEARQEDIVIVNSFVQNVRKGEMVAHVVIEYGRLEQTRI